jgi:hypothetical protein
MNARTRKHSERKRVSAISHNHEDGSPLGRLREGRKLPIDKDLIKSLSKFLAKNHARIKTELLSESDGKTPVNRKSMMDTENILE